VDENTPDLHIPTLEEMFQKFPGIPFNIDLKQESQYLLDTTHELIKKYKREDLVIWGSFRESTVMKAYKKDPEIALLFSFKGIVRLLALYYTGLLPFFPLKESFLEIPVFTRKSGLMLMPYTSTRRIRIFRWLIENILVSKRLFHHLNKRGITVFSWVQNSEEEFEFCFEHGVNGIMTDKPALLSEFLKKGTREKDETKVLLEV